jgi:holo-[acyl-carrier protein] synthase
MTTSRDHGNLWITNVLWITGCDGKVSAVIVSVGNDVVLVERFITALKRTPMLVERLFTEAERTTRSGNPRSAESLAARFAAKEAVAKALGAPSGLHWHDCEIVVDPDGRPWLTVSGSVAAAAADRGIERWHLSLSHDGGIASAVVIAEAGVSEGKS